MSPETRKYKPLVLLRARDRGSSRSVSRVRRGIGCDPSEKRLISQRFAEVTRARFVTSANCRRRFAAENRVFSSSLSSQRARGISRWPIFPIRRDVVVVENVRSRARARPRVEVAYIFP